MIFLYLYEVDGEQIGNPICIISPKQLSDEVDSATSQGCRGKLTDALGETISYQRAHEALGGKPYRQIMQELDTLAGTV